MIIITSGARYIDIDAYACCVAYAELLNVLGAQAAAVSTSLWNESITPTLRSLNAPLLTAYTPQPNDNYIMVDVSDPAQLDTIVAPGRIVEIIDHHTGFEQHWEKLLGDRCFIDFIGAAGTLVYERWEQTGKLNNMSKTSAQLLAAAILDNTLNFGAMITTERDKAAYKYLAKHASLDDTWVTKYFSECQETILADIPKALRNDTKSLRFDSLSGEIRIGQLVVWDAEQIIANNLKAIEDVFGESKNLWFANIVSVSEGRSYFIAPHIQMQAWLRDHVRTNFSGIVAATERLWLRKEIIKTGQT